MSNLGRCVPHEMLSSGRMSNGPITVVSIAPIDDRRLDKGRTQDQLCPHCRVETCPRTSWFSSCMYIWLVSRCSHSASRLVVVHWKARHLQSIRMGWKMCLGKFRIRLPTSLFRIVLRRPELSVDNGFHVDCCSSSIPISRLNSRSHSGTSAGVWFHGSSLERRIVSFQYTKHSSPRG